LNPRFDSAGRRRSERVSLQLRLLLETRLDDEKLISTEAFTLVVNAHGGLLEINLKLRRQQKIWLINPGTRTKEPGVVIGARKSHDGLFAIAFEFERPSPEFWPINFPPRDWQLVHAK